MTRARLLNLVGVLIGIAGIVFVTLRIIRDWDDIVDALSTADLIWLVAAFVSGLAAMALIGVNWLWIIRAADVPASWRRGLSWFFVGQLGKYVPGGIWPIVGQAELAHRSATPRPVAYTSTAMSMVATFLGAATVGAATGLLAAPEARWVPALIGAGLVIIFVALASTRVRAATHRLIDRIVRRELRLPSARWLLHLVARHLPVWILFAGMNIFTVSALETELDRTLVLQLIYATCLSWMAGFVVVGVPGGLGVRETVFISMMTGPLGGTLAVSVAVVSRVVSVAVDLTGAAVSVPVARTSPPLPRGEGDEATRYAAP